MTNNTLFFFSSRRRHTRWPRDWSSDVCSSDLRASGWPRLPWASSGRVGPAHPAPPLGRALVLVQPAPGAILLRPRHGVAEALGADRAGRADNLGLALPNLPLWLALAIRAEEEHDFLTAARRVILPAPVRPGHHGGLTTYLRHGSISSTS